RQAASSRLSACGPRLLAPSRVRPLARRPPPPPPIPWLRRSAAHRGTRAASRRPTVSGRTAARASEGTYEGRKALRLVRAARLHVAQPWVEDITNGVTK